MNIVTKYSIGDKVTVVVKGAHCAYKVIDTSVIDARLVIATSPFLVFKVNGSDKEYIEGEMFENRESLSKAFIEKAGRMAFGGTDSINLNEFITVYEKQEKENHVEGE